MSRLLDRVTRAVEDRYEVVEELGRGGMAMVFRATDRKHDRQVAVKVLLPELAASVGGKRFLREIEIAAGLVHPHILPLYDSGEAEGLLFHVTPCLEGETLRERLLKLGAWLERSVQMRVGQQFADRGAAIIFGEYAADHCPSSWRATGRSNT